MTSKAEKICLLYPPVFPFSPIFFVFTFWKCFSLSAQKKTFSFHLFPFGKKTIENLSILPVFQSRYLISSPSHDHRLSSSAVFRCVWTLFITDTWQVACERSSFRVSLYLKYILTIVFYLFIYLLISFWGKKVMKNIKGKKLRKAHYKMILI